MDFSPRRQFKDAWMFFVGFSFFVIIGFFLLPRSYDVDGNSDVLMPQWESPISPHNLGYFWTSFASILLILVTVKSCAIGVRYSIDEQGIHLAWMFRPHSLAFKDILKIEKIGEERVEDLAVQGYNAPFTSLKEAWQRNLKQNHFIRYCSVPIIFSGKFKKSANTSGDFVLITTATSKFLISPYDVDKFLTYARSYNKR